MPEVKWIKITTTMFEDEKIDFIESLPEADSILVIWIKLLTQAGKNNMDGFIFLTENIPYTDEMLSHKFRRPLSVVRMALAMLKKLEMIEYDNEGFLKIANWEKHQNIEGLDKIREQTRIRVAKHREKKKELSGNNNSNVSVTLRNATEEELEEERDIDIDIEGEVEEDSESDELSKEHKELIIDKWNSLDKNIPTIVKLNSKTERYKSLKARIEDYGLDKVIDAINDINKSSFLKGKNNRNWVITFDWFIKPNNFIKVLEGNYTDKKVTKSKDFEERDYDYDELEKKLLGWE